MPEQDWVATIKSELEENDSSFQVKKLRKKVLQSLDLEDSDKDGKKKFKKTMKELEEEGIISIDAEGAVTLKKEKKDKKRKKEKKKEKKQKKRKTEKSEDIDEGDDDNAQAEDVKEEEEEKSPATDKEEGSSNSKSKSTAASEKGVPCNGNPQGVTRLFLGNLPFTVDEAGLGDFLPGVTHIKWITDKETGKFYGSAFIEMDTPSDAAKAVAKSGKQLMNRPIKVNFAPARPGDIWPPANKVVSGGDTKSSGGGGQAGGRGIKAMGPKPDDCLKLFIGNLSYDIDDDAITKFFDNVGAEVKAVRWLSHKETGDFKGVYVY